MIYFQTVSIFFTIIASSIQYYIRRIYMYAILYNGMMVIVVVIAKRDTSIIGACIRPTASVTTHFLSLSRVPY
jgi:hypothetical protein